MKTSRKSRSKKKAGKKILSQVAPNSHKDSKKKASKKSAAKKKASKKKSSKKSTTQKFAPPPSGYERVPGSDLLRPKDTVSVVPASKFQKGIEVAKKEIRDSLSELFEVFSKDYEISEITLSESFDADGKFLGFGVGGSTSISITIRPE